MTRPGRLTPQEAAPLVGLSVEELLALAGDGKVPRSTLGASGWHFHAVGLRVLAERIARSHGPTA
jgi:hypothetical protein